MRVHKESLLQGGNNWILLSTGEQSNANWNNYDLAGKSIRCNTCHIQ